MELFSKSNEELLGLLKSNFTDQVFIELFNRFMPMYRNYSKRIQIHGFDFDDYLQEARIALMIVVDTFTFRKNNYVASYYGRIFENRLLNYCRKANAKKRITQYDLVSLEDLVPSSSDNPDSRQYSEFICEPQSDVLDMVIANDHFSEFIDSLSKLERAVLAHSMLSPSYKPVEIAQTLNIDVKTVGNAIARARRKCRFFFQD